MAGNGHCSSVRSSGGELRQPAQEWGCVRILVHCVYLQCTMLASSSSSGLPFPCAYSSAGIWSLPLLAPLLVVERCARLWSGRRGLLFILVQPQSEAVPCSLLLSQGSRPLIVLEWDFGPGTVSYLPWDRGFLIYSPPSHSGFYPRLLLFSQQLKPSGFCSTSEKRSGRAWGLAPFLQWQLSPSHVPAMSTWGRPTEQSLGVHVKPPVSKARPVHPMLSLQQFVAIWGDAFSLVHEAGMSSSTFSSLLAPAELVHTSLCGVQAVWLPCDSALW